MILLNFYLALLNSFELRMATVIHAKTSKTVKWSDGDKRNSVKLEVQTSEGEESPTNRSGYKRTIGPKKMTLQCVLENQNRSLEEARFLFKVVKDMPFFRDFNKRQNLEESDQDMLISLCKNIKYERYQPTDVIFKENQPSDGKFYMVMKGIVYVVQSTEKTKNFFEEQNRMINNCSSPTAHKPTLSRSDSDTSNPQLSRRGSQLADSRRSSINSRQGSRRNSMQGKNLVLQEPRKSSLGLNNDAMLKLKEFQKSRDVSVEPSPSNKLGLASRFKVLKESIESESSPKNPPKISLGIERASSIEAEARNNANNAREENGDIDSPQNKGKLKNTTDKLMKMIKLKKGFAPSGPKSQAVTLQDRVSEYGMYRDKIEQGGSFGHAALQKGNVKRNATTVAATNVELLVIQKDDLQIVRDHFHKTRMQMKDFLLKYFPCMNDVNASKTIESYLYLMKEGVYNQGTVLCEEGTIDEKIFIIFEGKCQLLKTFTMETAGPHRSASDVDHHMRTAKTIEKTLPISILDRGAFIGEETLFNQHERYEYTVKVLTQKAVVYSIDREVFLLRFPRMTFEGIKQSHLLRQTNHVEVVNSILKTMYPSRIVAQNTNIFDTTIGGKEQNLNQLKQSEEVFANPIVMVPVYDPLHKKYKAKASEPGKFIEMKGVKNKLLSYSHSYYAQNEDSDSSSQKSSLNLKSPRWPQGNLRTGLNDVQKTNIEEYKIKLLELQKEEKLVQYDKDGSISAREGKSQNNHRKLALRNQELELSSVDQYLNRAVNNFCCNKDNEFLKPKNPSNIDEYKLGFGYEYELDRKKKGWDSNLKLKKSKKQQQAKQLNPGIHNIIGNYIKAKGKSDVFAAKRSNSSFNIEAATIKGIGQSITGIESPRLQNVSVRLSQPQLQNAKLKSLEHHQTQPNQSLESIREKDSSYAMLSITSPRQAAKRSLQYEDSQSFGLNTEVSKKDPNTSKESKGGAVVQNLVKRYQTLKALSRHPSHSKIMEPDSTLIGTLTSTGLGYNGSRSDSIGNDLLPPIYKSYSYGKNFLI